MTLICCGDYPAPTPTPASLGTSNSGVSYVDMMTTLHKISKGLRQMIMDDNAVILDEKVFNICFDRPN